MNSTIPQGGWLPPDDVLRAEVHGEIHARPAPRLALPALVLQVVVLNAGVDRAAEYAHLRRLPGQEGLDFDSLSGNFLQLPLDGYRLRWERHTEFTRYTLEQTLRGGWSDVPRAADVPRACAIDPDWLRKLPGRTIGAVAMALLHGDPTDTRQVLERARDWFGASDLVASQLGRTPGGAAHTVALTDFRLRADGFLPILVLTPAETAPARAGRVAQRLLDVESYRLMALRGLPAAKALAPSLMEVEATLASLMAELEVGQASDPQMLHRLMALAGTLERASLKHDYRFAATRAYGTLINDRLGELRETALPGTPRIGEFLHRRVAPALATVAATAQRLESLSQRVERASALLRTRVDIATEMQNQQLLAKLNRGQQMQLRLQATVEGLSIAAISYYVISLLFYVAKAAHTAGFPVAPELAVGVLIPLVLWAVWRTTKRVHARLRQRSGGGSV